MKILFWGTPDFAVPSLRALDDEGFDIVGVVTQPDRPSGRGRRLAPSPVKKAALSMGLPVLTPELPRGDEFLSRIRALGPDVSVVVAYGHILKPEVLEIPKLGSINVHASLLPRLRGAAPVNWAIARGHRETGITIMRMVEAMDAGPVLHAVSEPILPDETASELTDRLAEVGAAALVEALAILSVGWSPDVDQDHDQATYAPKVDRKTARVDWDRPAHEVACHIRAMDAVPGAWSMLRGSPVKLFRPTVLTEPVEPAPGPDPAGNGGAPRADGVRPGSVLRADGEMGLVVATAEGSVRVGEVQPAGSRRMRAADWINGRGIGAGDRLE